MKNYRFELWKLGEKSDYPVVAGTKEDIVKFLAKEFPYSGANVKLSRWKLAEIASKRYLLIMNNSICSLKGASIAAENCSI